MSPSRARAESRKYHNKPYFKLPKIRKPRLPLPGMCPTFAPRTNGPLERPAAE